MKKKIPKYTPSENNEYFYRDQEMFRSTMETDENTENDSLEDRK